jgi:hypothetical protein
VRTLLAATIGMLVLTTPQAFGQAAGGLASELAKGVTCTSPDASVGLLTAVAKTTAPAADILAALGAIGNDAAACEPVRNAAKELAVSLAASVPAVAEVPTAAASSAVLAEVEAEAERRAASLKFEVGPPPPNLTRGRSPGL